VRRHLLIGSCCVAIAACLEVPAPPARDALDVKDVSVSAGVGLETACTPTGPEICFDARDDNCNGVIDEGCGLHTGILQFTIAWEATEADVDLNVHDPNGELAKVGETTAAGLQKDKDCPKPACMGQNVENVFLAEGDPKRGRYRVVVRLDKLDSATAPVTVRLGARVGQRSFGMTVQLSPGAGTEERSFEFTL
jgi:tRNA (guanosine-2'-O-)-methyltransferase